MKFTKSASAKNIVSAYDNVKQFVEKVAYCDPYKVIIDNEVQKIQSTMMHTFVMKLVTRLHTKFAVDGATNKEICLKHIWNDCIVLNGLIKASKDEFPSDLVRFVNALINEMRVIYDDTSSVKINKITSYVVDRLVILDTLHKSRLKEYKFLSELATVIAAREVIDYADVTNLYEILSEQQARREYVLGQINETLLKYETSHGKFIAEDISVIKEILAE